jgi:hypothetical protein
LPDRRLPPPELIIQDELHLISGPLGTSAGLYETALETLCVPHAEAPKPKIIASTATVRRAAQQIRALFDRADADIFPPPGLDRRDSFFAETHPPTKTAPRLYVGVAAQGRSLKVVMLRTDLALMAAAAMNVDLGKISDRLYVDLEEAGVAFSIDQSDPTNPVVDVDGAKLPVSKDFMVVKKKWRTITYKLPGLTVYAPETGKVYVSQRALRILNRI